MRGAVPWRDCHLRNQNSSCFGRRRTILPPWGSILIEEGLFQQPLLTRFDPRRHSSLIPSRRARAPYRGRAGAHRERVEGEHPSIRRLRRLLRVRSIRCHARRRERSRSHGRLFQQPRRMRDCDRCVSLPLVEQPLLPQSGLTLKGGVIFKHALLPRKGLIFRDDEPRRRSAGGHMRTSLSQGSSTPLRGLSPITAIPALVGDADTRPGSPSIRPRERAYSG